MILETKFLPEKPFFLDKSAQKNSTETFSLTVIGGHALDANFPVLRVAVKYHKGEKQWKKLL